MSQMAVRLHVERFVGNPILSPRADHPYQVSIYNPAVLFHEGTFYMLFRGQPDTEVTGLIGIATSKDGVHFRVHEEPIIVPEFEYERSGCEDPRLVRLDGRFVCTYVGKDGRNDIGHLCMAVSSDMRGWSKLGVVLVPKPGKWYARQIKAGAVFPFRVRGRYAMVFLGERRPWHTAIGIAFSDDFVHWTIPEQSVVLAPRTGYFDSMGVEPGPPPILLDEGILLLYNGWNEEKVHCIGAALLDPEEPRRVLWRSDTPLLEPEQPWERKGMVPNVVFGTGLVHIPPFWWLYYGAADRVIGVARVRVGLS